MFILGFYFDLNMFLCHLAELEKTLDLQLGVQKKISSV